MPRYRDQNSKALGVAIIKSNVYKYKIKKSNLADLKFFLKRSSRSIGKSDF